MSNGVNDSRVSTSRCRRLLVLSSTFPAKKGDSTPGFVRDVSEFEARQFETTVVVPRVPGAPVFECVDGLSIYRFRYFPRRWERLADGAILDNLRARPSCWLQVLPFCIAGTLAARRAARRVRPDVIHAHWLIPQGVSALITARRVPLVVTTLGADIYALRSRPLQWVKRRVVARCRSITTQNVDMRAILIEELGADPAKAFVLPVPVDLAVMTPDDRHRDVHSIVFVGRLVEKKGVSVLLAALRKLDGTVPYRLRVIGDGPLRRQLEAEAAGLNVTFLGALGRADVAAELARASVAVLPSVRASSGDQDGLPVVLLEAMAAGCAVVASRLPGLDEVIEHGSNGFLVESDDVDQLASAVAVLMANPPPETLRRAATERVQAYSIESIGERFCELLERAISSTDEA
jgi:colanic acid/amylovoran biosynthesis glycosyltransferase